MMIIISLEGGIFPTCILYDDIYLLGSRHITILHIIWSLGVRGLARNNKKVDPIRSNVKKNEEDLKPMKKRVKDKIDAT